MANLTPAQDKALKAFGADGEFPKGTRAATIEGIRAAGLIMHWNGDDSWDLTPDGRAYLGLAPIANTTTTVDEIVELLEPVADWERELTRAVIDMFPAQWSDSRYVAGNVKVWQNLTVDEIRKDIATAVPIGREGMRRMRKHAKHNH